MICQDKPTCIQAFATNDINICEFSGFRSNTVLISVLLGYGDASIRDWCLAFGDFLVVFSVGRLISEDETIVLSRNVGHNRPVTRRRISEDCRRRSQDLA
jgi:hypothetical protein